MTPELKQYLTSWLAWVERGAPHRDPYLRCDGLCMSIWSSESLTVHGMQRLEKEIQSEFIKDGLTEEYPFGEDAYYEMVVKETQHECPKRLAWVKKKLDIPA